jgi:hypothetical protein
VHYFHQGRGNSLQQRFSWAPWEKTKVIEKSDAMIRIIERKNERERKRGLIWSNGCKPKICCCVTTALRNVKKWQVAFGLRQDFSTVVLVIIARTS